MAHILVVDDETSIVAVLKGMLTRLGHDVITASNGHQAFDLVSLDDIDLIVTDIVMPDMNGIDLITMLQEKFPKLKIIAMSGGSTDHGPEGFLSEARNLGAARCLAKPFMLNELASLVNTLLEEPPAGR